MILGFLSYYSFQYSSKTLYKGSGDTQNRWDERYFFGKKRVILCSIQGSLDRSKRRAWILTCLSERKFMKSLITSFKCWFWIVKKDLGTRKTVSASLALCIQSVYRDLSKPCKDWSWRQEYEQGEELPNFSCDFLQQTDS